MLPIDAMLVLAALAVYRQARFLAWEDGPYMEAARFRIWLASFQDPVKPLGKQFGWAVLAGCPYCLGFWLALLQAAIVMVRLLLPALWPITDFWLIVWGLAGAQALALDIFWRDSGEGE